MGTEAYLLDSYACMEMLRGNQAYQRFTTAMAVLTKLNLFEVYHALLRQDGIRNAEVSLERYYPLAVDFDRQVIREAAQLRVRLRERNLSMADCVGYTLALQMGVRFLTGDRQFKDLPNVEFVK